MQAAPIEIGIATICCVDEQQTSQFSPLGSKEFRHLQKSGFQKALLWLQSRKMALCN